MTKTSINRGGGRRNPAAAANRLMQLDLRRGRDYNAQKRGGIVMAKKKLLIISPEVPGFPGTGAQVREYYLIKTLRERFDVVLVSCIHPGFEKYVEQARERGCQRHLTRI